MEAGVGFAMGQNGSKSHVILLIMVSPLHITAVQTTLHWENPALNRLHIEALLADIGTTDMIILPEMFTTGFSMQPSSLAETSSEKTAL